MAFAYTVSTRTVMGNKRVHMGTFTNASTDSGGAIVTGLERVDWFGLSFNSHVGTEVAKQTISGGSVTIVTSDGADGTWLAIGR